MFTSVAYVSVVIVSLLFATAVQIQVGVMDSHGRQVRGSRVYVRLSKDSDAKEVVWKAQEQMARLNCLFTASASYSLHYPDGHPADTLPGSDQPFSLVSYKEMVMTDYSRIALFLKDSELG